MFSKKYFQDRPILFLNLVVALGAFITVIATVLRINTSQPIVIIRYQVSLGLSGFQRANTVQLYSFAIAAVLIAISSIVISAKMYHKRRSLSIVVLCLSVVALLFNLIVSGAILNLQ